MAQSAAERRALLELWALSDGGWAAFVGNVALRVRGRNFSAAGWQSYSEACAHFDALLDGNPHRVERLYMRVLELIDTLEVDRELLRDRAPVELIERAYREMTAGAVCAGGGSH